MERNGVIALSGVYNLTEYSKGYFDEVVYFNSPQHYLPNLSDHFLGANQEKYAHSYLQGSGPYEAPAAGGIFAKIPYDKEIHYEFDVWGREWSDDWDTWRAVLSQYLETKF